MGTGPGLDLLEHFPAGQEPTPGIVGDPVQIDVHVEVGLHPCVASTLEEAEQPRLGDRDPGPEEVGRVGTGRQAGMSGFERPTLCRVEQSMPLSPAACGGIDHEEADVGTVIAFDDGHDGDRRVAEDRHGLLGGQQCTLELGNIRRIVERAGAEPSQGVEVTAIERSRWDGRGPLRHRRDAAVGMEASKLSCVCDRSRFCPGRVVRK